MNNIRAGVIIAIIHYALSFFLPWWTIIFISLIVVALLKLEAKASWLVPALAIMLSWLIQILILDQKTDFRSSQRIADIFGAQGFVSYFIALSTIGLIAGISGYLAYLLFGKKELRALEEEKMTIEDYKDNTPGLQDKGII